ncbi:MAG: hypothetical protein MPW15_17535 [Candidatus Manganitrophus sp.]|nr:hypothetical protein [Candidatus Manganitrophus sp.]
MENEIIKERVQQALDCVQGLDEPYRGIAFQVILKELLREGTAPEIKAGSALGSAA